MNNQDSPIKKIDPKLHRLVERAVRLERSTDVSYEVEGVVLDSSANRMVQLGEKLWMLDAFRKHREEECIDLHKFYIIGRQAVASERFAVFTFSNLECMKFIEHVSRNRKWI